MAQKKKKKKNGGNNMPPINPVRYMREKARNCPVYKCYLFQTAGDEGMVEVVVLRERPGGKYIMGAFLIDKFCLGVKDAMWNHSLFPEEVGENIERMEFGLGPAKEITYDEAHCIIWGSIDFARKGGIEPHPDFGIAQYVIEPRDTEVKNYPVTFGHEGKHLLIEGPFYREKQYIPTLRKHLGEDGFHYLLTLGDDEPMDFDPTSEELLNEEYADDNGEEFTEEQFEAQEEREMEEEMNALDDMPDFFSMMLDASEQVRKANEKKSKN